MAESQAPIKSLEVQIEAQANAAITALDKLADHLDKVAQKLSAMSGDVKALGSLSTAINKISKVTEKSAKATKEVNNKKVAPKVDTSQAEKLNKVMDEVRKKMTLADALEVKPKFSGMNEQMFKKLKEDFVESTRVKQLPAVIQKNQIAEIEEQAKAAAKVSAATKQATDSIKQLESESDRGLFGTKTRRGDGGLTRAGMEAKEATGEFKKAADALGEVSKAAAKPLSTDIKERAKQFAQMLREEDPSLTEKRAALLGKVMAGYKKASSHIDEVKKRHEEAAAAAERQAAAEKEAAKAAQGSSKGMPTGEIERATSAWTTFLDSAKELAPMMKKVVSIMGKAAKSVASGAAKMAKAIIRPLKTVKQLGSSLRSLLGIEKRSGGLLRGRSLGQFIGLIAFRRAITAALRALTSGIKEGSDNLTHYSAEYNNSISSMVSSLNYLKNAWAAAFAPIVNVVAPYISAFIDMLAAALNAIGRFMAVLTGKGFAVQAVKGWTDVAAAANSAAGGAGKAAKAAEEYKRTIMSFDELHVLNAPDDGSGSGGSGGGGGGGSATDYASMFTTVAVDTEEGLAAALRKAFEAGDFEEIGNLIAEKIATSLDKLNWTDIETKASGVASKLARTINGFIDNDHVWSSLGSAIGGAINTASGTVATFFDEVKFKKLGEQIGTAVNKAVQKWKPSKTAKAIAGIINSGISTSYGFLSTAKFSALGTKVGKMTIDAINKIKWDSLGSSIALAITGLFNFINNYMKTPGLFTSLGTNIKNGIKAWFATMSSKGAWASMTSAVGNAMEGLLDFIIALLPSGKEWTEIGDYIVDMFVQGIDGINASQLARIAEKIGELLGRVLKYGVMANMPGWAVLSYILDKNGMGGDLADQGAGNTFDTDVEVNFKGKVDQSLTDGKKILDSVKSKTVTATGKGKQDPTFGFFTDKNKNWRKMAANKMVTATAAGNTLQTFIDLYREYVSIVNKKITITAEALADKVRLFFNVFGNAHGGILMANGWQPIQGYASGGLVTAEHFIARENGMPELVGRIGTHTAVMNNDQIVSSVANGVYRATVAAMNDSGRNNNSMPYQINVTVKTQNDEVLARAVQRGNASRNYRANAFA